MSRFLTHLDGPFIFRHSEAEYFLELLFLIKGLRRKEMHLKKLTSLVFLFVLTCSSFTPSFSAPPEDEKKQGITQRKLALSPQEETEDTRARLQAIRDRPTPDFWDSIPVEEFRQAPWQYQCFYCLYNLCCGCFRVGQ